MRSALDIKYIALSGTNLGGGEDVFKNINPSNTLNFKTLVGAGGILISGGTNTVLISGGSSGGGGTITGGTNGLSTSGSNVKLGGGLTGDTVISGTSYNLSFTNNAWTFGSRAAGVIGVNSFAIGTNVLATGLTSYVEGEGSEATGNYSHAEGYYTKAIGLNSHAEGEGTQAIGESSHAEGYYSTTEGLYSHSEGYSNNAYADYSHAEGYQNNILTGQTDASHAEGRDNYINFGLYSHVEGYQNNVNAHYSHAEGRGTQTSGQTAHAQNRNTLASGSDSHAGGKGYTFSDRRVTASGITSFNHSENTIAQTNGHGALAPNSAILAGINHNIPTTSLRSVVIGGNLIKVSASVLDTVHMPKVRLGLGTGGSLTTNNANTNIVVRNSTTGELELRTATSLTGTSIQTANNGLTKSGSNVRLGGTLTGATTIDGGNFALNLGRISSKLNIISATTLNQQIYTSNVVTADNTSGAFHFIDDTGTDSAGRYVAMFEKRWTGGGAPDGNNAGYLNFVMPSSTLVRRRALQIGWNLSPNTNGNEYTNYFTQGLYSGTSVNILRLNAGDISIGHATQSIGSGDLAIGLEAKAWNAGQTAIGVRAGKTSGAATGKLYSISLGYDANKGTYPIGNYSIAIGNAAIAKSGDTISIGHFAGNTTGAGGDNTISIGAYSNQGSSAVGSSSVAIGVSSKSIGGNAVAIGNGAIVNDIQGIAIGLATTSSGQGTIALGASSKAANFLSLAIGSSAGATSGSDGSEAISIGASANAGTTNIGQRSVAIGSGAKSKATNSIAMGYQAGNTTGTDGGTAISIGGNANQGTSNIGNQAIAIGSSSKSINDHTISIGTQATSNSLGSIAIGYLAGNTSGTINGISTTIGYRANNGTSNVGLSSVAIGYQATTTANGSIVLSATQSSVLTNNVADSFGLGWGNSTTPDYHLIKGTLTTSNNTQGTLLSYTLATGSTYSVRATVVARQTDGTDRAMFIIKSLAYREAGGAVIEGTLPYEIEEVTSTNAATWDATIDASGNDIRVRVTGATSETINWHVILQITRVS